MKIANRITAMLGVEYPIVQAPMGWIARSKLASAVSNAGGLGIIETSSGELDAIKVEIQKMRELTTKPFGVNVALAFVRDPGIVNFIIDQGVKFVTTSAGDPQKIVAPLKAAGLTVFHVVPSLKAALRAVDCGVDGLVVEGGEGGGFKNPREVSTMVLLPLVCETVKVPVVAAGGMVDGRTMAAAFMLGAEGIHELEERDSFGAGNRHRVPQPLWARSRSARAPHRKDHAYREGTAGQCDERVRPRARSLFRRRHGGIDRAFGPGLRPHPRDQAGQTGDRRNHRGVPRDDRKDGEDLRLRLAHQLFHRRGNRARRFRQPLPGVGFAQQGN
jgi:nitronate monooxygenase